MKNYSRKNAQRGKLSYRTPERFIYRKSQQVSRTKAQEYKGLVNKKAK